MHTLNGEEHSEPCSVLCLAEPSGPGLGGGSMRRKKQLTSPVRLGLLLTEEATELSELSEEALGLRFSAAGVGSALRTAGLALAGVVEGKPILVTLCTGANRPYLGWHWKYLPREKQEEERGVKFFSPARVGLMENSRSGVWTRSRI